MQSQMQNQLARKTLTRYGMMAEHQWEGERPKMYARLKKKGTLRTALIAAQQMCKAEIGHLLDQGYHLNEAEEIAFPQYLFLPSEAEMPILGQDPSARNNPPPGASPLQEGNALPNESYPQSKNKATNLLRTTSDTSTPTIKLLQKMLSGNPL